MGYRDLKLDPDPVLALAEIRDESAERAVVVFKKSPICPVSHQAEAQFREWLAGVGDADLAVAVVDVISQKPLARGLTQELGIDHQSPQALWFVGGELRWHDSHSALTVERFGEWNRG